MKVIPKVGQVWNCRLDNKDESILSIDSGGHVEWSDGSSSQLKDGYFDATMTFIPSSVLDHVAINCSDWHSNKNAVAFINSGIVKFTTHPESVNGVTHYQWKNKRNELFGEKPVTKMKVEYVKCNFESFHDAYTTISNTKDYYSIGEGDAIEFSSSYPAFDSDACAKDLMEHYKNLYCKVETPVTWQDDLEEFLSKKAFNGAHIESLSIGVAGDPLGGVSMDMDMRFNDFIEMCHLVASLTDNPNE